MRYLITTDTREILAEIYVPADHIKSVVIERADRPELLIAAADLHADGSVTVGNWPTGENWEVCLRTSGIPLPAGVEAARTTRSGTPARPRRRPRPPQPARATLRRHA